MNYRIGRSYKNLKRYKEIAEVLAKYGYGFFVKKLSDQNLVPSYILKKRSNDLALTTGERIRYICEELGPTFIKIGQLASTRADLLSEDIVKELIKLQDNVREIPIDMVIASFEKEFDTSIEEAFLEFEERPIAAASIGQVHKAILVTGENVIVKVQRPSIKKVVETDINILLSMSKLFDEYFGYMVPFSLNDMMQELTKSIKHELDYTKEARNTERFYENFKHDKKIYIPKIYWDYTSRRILTQELINGIKVSNKKVLKEKQWNTKKLADIGARAFLKQVFIYGFFHGDPHPGNILVIDREKVAFIDFGLCGYLDKNTVNMITSMFIAGAKRDIDKLIDLLIQLDTITEETNLTRLKEDLVFLISHYYNTPLKKIDMSELISEFMRITYENNIKLPSQFTVLIKAVITVEGTGRILDPEFSISTLMKEFTTEILKHKYNLTNLLHNASDFSEEIIYGLRTLPKQLRTIIKMLETNKIKLTLEEIKFEKLEKQINKSTNRLSISIIIASLIIGSSIALNSQEGPKILGVSAFSFIGYMMALVLVIPLTIKFFIENLKK